MSERLRRELILLDAVAVGLGAIIGAGIFVVIGTAIGVAGAALPTAVLIAAATASFNALSSAQLAARYPTSGGTYEYGIELLSPWAGFGAGWMFLVSKFAAGGTVALGFGHYMARVVPSLEPRATGVALVALLTLANCFGIRKAGLLNRLIVVLVIGALLVFVFAGFGSIRPENLVFWSGDWKGILEGAGLMFFAFTGYARIATLAEEVRDAPRTIPRAIIITLVGAAALYILVSVVALGVAGSLRLSGNPTPLETAAHELPQAGAASVILFGAIVALAGVLLSQVLGISRVMLAMGRRGDAPSVLSAVSARHHVPTNAILATGGIIALITLVGRLEVVLSAASFSILIYYGITNAAALRLSPEHRLFSPWVAWAGLTACIVLAVSLDGGIIAAGLGLLATGLILRFIFRKLTKAA